MFGKHDKGKYMNSISGGFYIISFVNDWDGIDDSLGIGIWHGENTAGRNVIVGK